MTNKLRILYLNQAADLATLGEAVERERSELKKLVNRGVSYDDPEMLRAFERFARADGEWRRLEEEHLKLRERLGIR